MLRYLASERSCVTYKIIKWHPLSVGRHSVKAAIKAPFDERVVVAPHRARIQETGNGLHPDSTVVVVRPIQANQHIAFLLVVTNAPYETAFGNRLAIKRCQINRPTIFHEYRLGIRRVRHKEGQHEQETEYSQFPLSRPGRVWRTLLLSAVLRRTS